MAKKDNAGKNTGGTKKKIWKKWWFWALFVSVLIGGVIRYTEPETEENTVATTETTATTESTTKKMEKETETAQEETLEKNEVKVENHIYDNAIVKDVMNGFRTEKIGEYSVVEIESSQVTEENLEDWYFNYVEKNDFNWSIILYTDKENEGVYANAGTISRDVTFDIDEYGDYSLGDCSKCITYVPIEEGALKEIYSTDNETETLEDISVDMFVEEIKSAIQGAVGENEKILDVIFENGDLCIYVDFSQADPKMLTLEDLALARTGSITDEILELKKYDSLWNTITVDFGEIGYIRNDKGNIKYNAFGRYFDGINFKLE